MSSLAKRWRALTFAVLFVACGDEDGAASRSDAGSPGDEGMDGSIMYRGPTRGGAIPEADALPPQAQDEGPFEVSAECCDRTLILPTVGDELSVQVVGNLPPLDGSGVTAMPFPGRYEAMVCMPLGESVLYHFEVESRQDGGSDIVYRIDPSLPHIEDEHGELWNVSAISACDDDAGAP